MSASSLLAILLLSPCVAILLIAVAGAARRPPLAA